MKITFSFFVIMILTIMITNVILMISKKNKINMYKSSAFECGFMNLSSPRKSFSIQFFMISIIFLIFDTEISIMLPMTYMKIMKFNEWMYSSISIMFIITLGLYTEWNQGLIEWKL
uniref:NADH-ubiquinone oxidoreductase chain 3 n=1 Tax=Nisia fuliginosa TaxID=2743077 RepID=A0A8A4JM56_9HEMI|nr:NADH dehydrogenase subunit 3 [Nisia fuliginosa]